jgi:aminoglycoside phosphotransferase (APT) family kinase protein
MSTPKMHPDEIDIDEPLIRRLIGNQFPQWAGLPITTVRSAGTDNAIYRLGDDMVVRLPRLGRAAKDVAKEQRWLPRLSPLLPLTIPMPLGKGRPDDGFPYPWSVYRWVDGEDAVKAPVADKRDAATQLGRFVAALQKIDAADGPPSFRGGPVGTLLDAEVRTRIHALGLDGSVEPEVATATWEAACRARAWDGPPVWVHADLFPMNLIVRQRRLAAVIDFGGLGVGDPACDMLPAWAWLTAPTRDLYRIEANVDDATWARGRGWGLALGLGAVQVYQMTNPVLAAIGRHAVAEAISDYRRNT